MTETDREAFDRFPRGRLSLKWDRRQVLTAFVTELRVMADERRGGSAYRLSDLGTLPDDIVELLTPTLAPLCTFVERHGFVCGYPRFGKRPVRLFSVASPAKPAFACFDGRTPLGAIARRLQNELGWESARAFAYVRGLFLHLVTLGFCLPK